MKPWIILPFLTVLTCAASAKPNVLLLCVDDLRPELASFGATHIHSPNIDMLAETGRAFHHHYVNAPSCGPSRFTLLTGRYGPYGNNAIFKRAETLRKDPVKAFPSMPEWFRTHGYTTVSVGKVSHHPGGLGGKDWNDPNEIEMPDAWDRHLMPVGEWEHPRGAMHGLAHGEIRVKTGDMDVFQSSEGPDEIYPDGLIVDEGLAQLKKLAADEKPFFLAVGVIKPHLPFGAPAEYMKPYRGMKMPEVPHPEKPQGKTTWHKSGEFMGYNRWGKDPREDAEFSAEVRRHYAACVTYADHSVGRILAELKKLRLEDETIVLLWGDHGWHLGEHAIWGKHSLFEESLRSPLIIRFPGIGKAGSKSDAVVETLDIFPTLCDLTGLPVPDYAQGTSLIPLLKDPQAEGHTALGYKGDVQTIRDGRWRMTRHKSGEVELYDHASPEKETVNVADKYPKEVERLTALLEERLSLKGASK